MTVAGNDIGVAGKAHHFVHDGLDERIIIAALQVGPADAAGKEGVAGKEDARRLAVVAYAAGRMAGGGDDHPVRSAGVDDLPVRNILIVEQFHGLMELEPVQQGGPEAEGIVVGLAHIDGTAEAPDERRDTPGMVKVSMGQKDGVGREGVVPEEREHLVFLLVPEETGIHDGAGRKSLTLCGILPENDAVLAQRIDLEYLDLKHGGVGLGCKFTDIFPTL